MIIVRSPLRITLGGGGTDLPSYYRAFGGSLIAGAIDRYVYVALNETFAAALVVRHSQVENVADASQLRHPIIREALAALGMDGKGLELTSMADIPAGTGLGSSGSFTTALLKALHTHNKHPIHPAELAEQACAIEIDRLGEPIGKQDQYIAAYGGVTCFEFRKDGTVEIHPIRMTANTRANLEDNLVLFFTGMARRAGSILAEQDSKTKHGDAAMIDTLHYIKDLGLRSKAAIETGDLETLGRLMDEHWQHKKRRSIRMSNAEIDHWYDLAMNNGALGGKLVGAGAGGFLMFYAEDKRRLRHVMREAGLAELRFCFDTEGTKVVV